MSQPDSLSTLIIDDGANPSPSRILSRGKGKARSVSYSSGSHVLNSATGQLHLVMRIRSRQHTRHSSA